MARTRAVEDLREAIKDYPALGNRVLKQIVVLSRNTEPAETVFAREIEYIKNSTTGILGLAGRWQLSSLIEPAVQAARQAELRATAQQRLFITYLAIDAFHRKQTAWPKTLAEISARIMAQVPLVDPYTNLPFVYRLQDDS